MGRGGHHSWRGCRGRRGHHWGPSGSDERGGQYHSSFSSSESSSDSDNECHESRKRAKKHWKKQMKKFRKFGNFRQFMADPMFAHLRPHFGSNISSSAVNSNCLKTMCTLCYHRIKPLVDTEVLECGHLYHRLCLKELLDLSLNRDNEQTERNVFCSECKDKVDNNLVNQFLIRLNGEPTAPHIAGQHLLVMDHN